MEDLATLFMQPATWIALVTLIAMEVVLGIDNLIFISILTNKLPENVRERARKIGISLALLMRLGLLSLVAFIVTLTKPLFELFGHGFRSEEHTSELQSLMRISYAVFCLKKKNKNTINCIQRTIYPTSIPISDTV